MWHAWISSGGEILKKKNATEHRLRREKDFEMDLIETGWKGMKCVCLAQVRALCQACGNMLMKIWIS